MRDKQQIIQWESRQRKKYREGLLPLDQIKKLESLSDWQWEIDLKQESIDKACEIFKYAEKIGRLPKNREKNVDWVKTKKQAKVGKGNGTIWYPELEEIAKQHGFPNVFDISLKQKAIEQAHEIFKYAKKTGRLPKKEEKNVNWIQNKKQYKAGKGKGIWYPELDEIAKQYGFSNAFGLLDKKQEAIEQAHEVFKYANKTGRLPNQNSKKEKKHANWLGTKKKAKYGKGNRNRTIWYPELEEIAQQYGFPHAFDIRDYKQEAIDKAREIFKKKQNSLLSKSDRRWIHGKKNAKTGSGNRSRWYPELDEIAKQYGFSNAFGLLDKKQEAIEQAHEVFKYANKTGRLPNYKEKNYNWIHAKKRAKAGKGNGTIWYPELEEIAQQYGFPNVFNKK